MEFKRRALLPNDVLIEMRYCGICHTDLHSAAGHAAAVMRTCFVSTSRAIVPLTIVL
jgi:D-arabinose 1-dehydrogenase-like Zn-dependent alcohol dehydrogenase